MPPPLECSIEQIACSGPFWLGITPTYVEAMGRCSRGCSSVAVAVRLAPGFGTPLFGPVFRTPADPQVEPGQNEDDPTLRGVWTARFDFDPAFPVYGVVQCGAKLWVEATAVRNSAAASDGRMLGVTCKGGLAPSGGWNPPAGGTGPTGQPIEWPWPFPPGPMCRLFKWLFGTTLLAALFLLAFEVVFGLIGVVGVAAAFGVASFFFGLWRIWCAPTLCEVFGVLCWAFKNGTVFAALLSIPVLSIAGLLTTALQGGVTAATIYRMTRGRCPIPPLAPPPF